MQHHRLLEVTLKGELLQRSWPLYASQGLLEVKPNSIAFNIPGHATMLMAWLKSPRRLSCVRDVGHSTPTMGLLNPEPRYKLSNEGGHVTSTIEASGIVPQSTNLRSDGGHDTPARGCPAQHSTSSICSDAGQAIGSKTASTRYRSSGIQAMLARSPNADRRRPHRRVLTT